jgi:hypothetical protein
MSVHDVYQCWRIAYVSEPRVHCAAIAAYGQDAPRAHLHTRHHLTRPQLCCVHLYTNRPHPDSARVKWGVMIMLPLEHQRHHAGTCLQTCPGHWVCCIGTPHHSNTS